jgi:hypothetical protein
VLPFSAFILGMNRECQVEDNAFSGRKGLTGEIFLSCQNEDVASAPKGILHDLQSSTNENAERRSSRSSFPHSFRVADNPSGMWSVTPKLSIYGAELTCPVTRLAGIDRLPKEKSCMYACRIDPGGELVGRQVA